MGFNLQPYSHRMGQGVLEKYNPQNPVFLKKARNNGAFVISSMEEVETGRTLGLTGQSSKVSKRCYLDDDDDNVINS